MRLGEVLWRYRLGKRQSIRSLAQEIGIPFATLARVERGQNCDASTLVMLMDWLFHPIYRSGRARGRNR